MEKTNNRERYGYVSITQQRYQDLIRAEHQVELLKRAVRLCKFYSDVKDATMLILNLPKEEPAE